MMFFIHDLWGRPLGRFAHVFPSNNDFCILSFLTKCPKIASFSFLCSFLVIDLFHLHVLTTFTLNLHKFWGHAEETNFERESIKW